MLATYTARIYKAIKTRFCRSSSISKAKYFFYSCKRLSYDLGKLAQQQGLSFLIGIAVGVNLLLVIQMSEDIIYKLSETTTISVIGIIAIISIIAFGITIVYLQKKTSRRIDHLSGGI